MVLWASSQDDCRYEQSSCAHSRAGMVWTAIRVEERRKGLQAISSASLFTTRFCKKYGGLQKNICVVNYYMY